MRKPEPVRIEIWNRVRGKVRDSIWSKIRDTTWSHVWCETLVGVLPRGRIWDTLKEILDEET
jgi:hypothetical protein